MTIELKKEQFSKAFIRAFSSTLGFNPSELEVDDDSIDLKLSSKNYTGLFSSPELHIQLKCTEQIISKDNYLHFQLSKKNYNDLRNTNIAFPRYLFVFLVPNNISDWIVESNDKLELKYKGLWYSLRGLPDLKKQSSKIIKIPSSNIITRDILSKMMEFSSQSKSL